MKWYEACSTCKQSPGLNSGGRRDRIFFRFVHLLDVGAQSILVRTIRVVAGYCDVREIMVIRMLIFYDPELDVSFKGVSEFPKELSATGVFF